VRKVVFCSGQVYYDLVAAREQGKHNDVAIVRIEQLNPFPFRNLIPIIQGYKNAKVVWSQEEHKNQGAYTFIEPRLRSVSLEVGNGFRF